MKNIKIASLFALFAVLFFVGCTTYVSQPIAQQGQPQYEYNPGYNPDNTVADTILAAALINGISGYYGPGHIFYPSAMYGGVPGYYVGGVFHTSTQYRTTIVNNYNTGRQDFQRNPTAYAQSHPTAVSKPNYTSQGQGSKGASTATTTKPTFGSGTGTSTRVAATAPATPTPAPKPSFGSGAGSSSRSSAPSAPSRPSFGSSSSSSSSSRRR